MTVNTEKLLVRSNVINHSGIHIHLKNITYAEAKCLPATMLVEPTGNAGLRSQVGNESHGVCVRYSLSRVQVFASPRTVAG